MTDACENRPRTGDGTHPDAPSRDWTRTTRQKTVSPFVVDWIDEGGSVVRLLTSSFGRDHDDAGPDQPA